MNFRAMKLPIVVAAVLLGVSLSSASTQTEEHPKPVHHKAHKVAHHAVARHESPKTAHPETPTPAAQRETLKASHPETPKAHHTSKKSRRKRVRGQQAIDGERARQIQAALAREHYIKGEPSGKWDSTTQEAMRRYQGAQGWQTKTVPDSRALIRLGLGPDHGHLLNPESAMITDPQLPHGTATTRQPAPSANSGAAIHPAAAATHPAAASGAIATPAAVLPPSH